MTSYITFARRRREDSTVDTICTRCCQTIANDSNEAGLIEAEQAHYCDPVERQDIGKLCP